MVVDKAANGPDHKNAIVNGWLVAAECRGFVNNCWKNFGEVPEFTRLAPVFKGICGRYQQPGCFYISHNFTTPARADPALILHCGGNLAFFGKSFVCCSALLGYPFGHTHWGVKICWLRGRPSTCCVSTGMRRDAALEVRCSDQSVLMLCINRSWRNGVAVSFLLPLRSLW